MGTRIVKYPFCPKENEQIEVIMKVPEERRSVIHGVVKNHKDNIVTDAVVKLFEVINPSKPLTIKPITYTFTDEFGQFLFGPLSPNKKYLIKVWYYDPNETTVNVKIEGAENEYTEDCECSLSSFTDDSMDDD